MDEFDPIEQGRRYVLGETPTHYGVWDKQAGTELIEEFPLTDEGFELAAERFNELKRHERTARGSLLYLLWFAILIGVLTMVAGGVMELLGQVFAVELFLTGPLAFSLYNIGNSVALGGLALLLGLTLIRREVRRRAAPDEALVPETDSGTTRSILWWIMLAALGIWVLSTIASELLFPADFGFGGRIPSRASRISMTVESLAFRIWVGLLAIWWGRRLLSRGERGKAEVAG